MTRLLCSLVALTMSLGMMGTAIAGVPLQADVAVEMPLDPGGSNSASAWIEIEGAATVTVTVTNQLDGEVAQIDMLFEYHTSDKIAFDEIIERIEIDTENLGASEPYELVLINSTRGGIPLNPNRASLSYRVSLYYPQAPEGYIARVKVYGNYE